MPGPSSRFARSTRFAGSSAIRASPTTASRASSTSASTSPRRTARRSTPRQRDRLHPCTPLDDGRDRRAERRGVQLLARRACRAERPVRDRLQDGDRAHRGAVRPRALLREARPLSEPTPSRRTGPVRGRTQPSVLRSVVDRTGELVVEAYDETPFAVPGPGTTSRSCRRSCAAASATAKGRTIQGWTTLVDFRFTIPSASVFDEVWADGVMQNHVRAPGRYRLVPCARPGTRALRRRGRRERHAWKRGSGPLPARRERSLRQRCDKRAVSEPLAARCRPVGGPSDRAGHDYLPLHLSRGRAGRPRLRVVRPLGHHCKALAHAGSHPHVPRDRRSARGCSVPGAVRQRARLRRPDAVARPARLPRGYPAPGLEPLAPRQRAASEAGRHLVRRRLQERRRGRMATPAAAVVARRAEPDCQESAGLRRDQPVQGAPAPRGRVGARLSYAQPPGPPGPRCPHSDARGVALARRPPGEVRCPGRLLLLSRRPLRRARDPRGPPGRLPGRDDDRGRARAARRAVRAPSDPHQSGRRCPRPRREARRRG